jgi:FkbM family methyltransferase
MTDMEVSLRIAEMLRKVRSALASRYLFDNWFTLLIRHALTRLGFNVKLMARVGDCTFELSPEAFGCLAVRASYGAIEISCVDGELYVNGGRYGKYHGAWVYDNSCNCYVRNNVKFRQIYWAIYQVFDCGEYEPLDVSGRVVVDAGAYIGDSAIYFALRGAKRVIAVEPHPNAYAEMLDNIRLNNLEDVIIPINAGLASKPGKICIENVSVGGTGKTYHKPGDCPNAVPAVTLGELIDRFSVNPSDAVLKMDCEGCEFDVILNDYDHVRLFRELIFEYHPMFVNKSLEDLLNVLGKDYKCDIRGGDEDLGVMHCIKK